MRTFQELSVDDKRLALEYFANGQYYLLLGSRVSLDSEGPSESMCSAMALRAKLVELNNLPTQTSLQQSYKLLTAQQVEEQLTSHYTCNKPGDTIKCVSEHPWKRIYTFNIDNCFEFYFRQLLKDKSFDEEFLEVFHFLDDFSDLRADKFASLVHLHGSVEQPEKGYVFSHGEYAKLMTRPNSWMLTLVQMLRADPFLVMGTSLEESDVTYYLEHRNPQSRRADLPPSILVEPFPNKLTEDLCASHDFVLFEGTALEFLQTLYSETPNQPDLWRNVNSAGYEALNLDKRTLLQFSSSFEAVPKQPNIDQNPGRFYLGTNLSWGMLGKRVDVSREALPKIRSEIYSAVRNKSPQVYLLVDEPGSGKTALLKRLAFDIRQVFQHVYFFENDGFIDEDVCEDILDSIDGECFIFVDNWADHAAFIYRLIQNLTKEDIVFVGAERRYRVPYIEASMSEIEHQISVPKLNLKSREAEQLILAHEKAGLSSLGRTSPGKRKELSSELSGQPISVANCRIQNNFRQFDNIIDGLLNDCDNRVLDAYVCCAIARYCFSGGLRRQVLEVIDPKRNYLDLLDDNAVLPITNIGRGNDYYVPRRAIVADRILSRLAVNRKTYLSEIFSQLANALAPYVNRKQIRARSHEAKLTGRLLDFDQVVKKFINDEAENFYDAIKVGWDWNSRYWEQLALLKFDRYLADNTDRTYLSEAIQHARHAYGLERHPLSLTTLAKLLFSSLETESGQLESIFNEAWEMVVESVKIESSWDNIRATVFVVCFSGVLTYLDKGGVLTGEQTEQLRDIISTTHSRRLQDSKLRELRESVNKAVF